MDASEPLIHGAPLNASGSHSSWSNWASPRGLAGSANQPANADCRADNTFSAKRRASRRTAVRLELWHRHTPTSSGSREIAVTDETVVPPTTSPCQTVRTPTPVVKRRTA